MMNIEDFFISKEALEKVRDESVLTHYVEEGKPLQDIFGFSDAVTAEFYGTAKNILEQKRFEDAENAFVFLTTMNPYISDFWLGLGMSQQKNQKNDEALYSYAMAFTLEGKTIFPYVLAAQCCMAVKDFDRAMDVLNTAEEYADEHPEEKECIQLKKDAEAAKHYVLEQKQESHT